LIKALQGNNGQAEAIEGVVHGPTWNPALFMIMIYKQWTPKIPDVGSE
jgi:hypothetical protein